MIVRQRKDTHHENLLPIIRLRGAHLCSHVSPALAQQPIPEAAQQHFKAGVALIEKANVPDDLRSALEEFEAAADLAPLWPEIHYNLAQLAVEIDKPAKANKEFAIYLDLAPEAADREKIKEEIARQQGLIAIKRKIGLPGVTFAAMPDGIWVMQVYPGSRVGNTGLRKGVKIVAVEGTRLSGRHWKISSGPLMPLRPKAMP